MSSDGPRYPEYPEDPEASQQPPSSPPPSYGQTPPPPPPGLPQVRLSNQKAVWAMILGILGTVLCCLFAGVPAIILGTIARREIAASGGQQEGRGMATAGLVLGIVSTVLSVVYYIFMGVFIGTNGFGEGLE